jgi:hypothetical protein
MSQGAELVKVLHIKELRNSLQCLLWPNTERYPEPDKSNSLPYTLFV